MSFNPKNFVPVQAWISRSPLDPAFTAHTSQPGQTPSDLSPERGVITDFMA
jgi:hypothetical protein